MKTEGRSKKLWSILIVIVAATLLLSACGGDAKGGEEAAEQEKKIRIGIVNWTDSIAMSNIVRVILEEELGYTVETTYADIAVIFSSIAQKDYDLYVDAWLPVTHKTYMEEYGEDLEKISQTFQGARIGLVVPEYVDIDSIAELNANKEKFDGDIIGIDTGAGIMKTTNTAIEEYGLDFDLKASSGPVMTATLKGAIEENKWVVVTGWKPHWKFARWDLKFLEDPKKIYGEVENTWAVGHTDFREDFPDVTKFLENFMLTDQQLGTVMGMMNDSDKEAYEVAKEWVQNNPEAVQEWVP
ncbi:MAG: glycine betaine ABC transporter substrate-binding protein [Spirochaetia bacterium]|nr:glycine betaine ABC transporter substrate-binding protein [Spirochaetia bacterium]